MTTNRLRVYIKQSIQSYLDNRGRSIKTDHARIGWTIPGFDASKDNQPLA